MEVFRDPKCSVEERVADLVDRLSEEEKLLCLTGQDMWSWRPIERLGIPAIKVTDGPHGVTCGTGDPAMSYPTAVGMASTWNQELIEEVGVALAEEMHAKGYDILLGPAIDIQRAPKFGRNYECYSEDPVLAGKMGVAWIRGVQSQGIGTTPKHFVAYSTSGFMDDVIVDEQALRELYLKPFEIVIKEAQPTGLMSSYNQVNGHPTSQQPMQRDIVKDEWGFDGFITSDWRGALDIVCIENGMDIEMPGPGKIATPEALRAEIDKGTIDWQRIDDAVTRLVRFYVRCGIVDHNYQKPKGEQNTPKHRDLARRVAEESMVLLKNENNILPFDKNTLKQIALIGPNAAAARLGGGGSAAVSPFYEVSPLEGLRNVVGEDVNVAYAEGCAFKGNMPVVEADVFHDMQVSFYEANDLSGEVLATQSVDQINHAWGWVSPINGVPKNDWSAEWNGILEAPSDGEYTLGLTYQDGGVRLWLDDELLIDDWQSPDDEDFEAGYKDLSQTGTATLKAGQRCRLRIAYRKYANRASLRFEWGKPQTEDALVTAVRLAKESDLAVVCVGLSNQFEGGGAKRADMELPGQQNELIKAVHAANPNTVVVLIGGSPLIMEQWVESVPGLIQAWYPGVEGGNALANVLSGAVNPSGKLPNTLPKSYEDTPVCGHEDPLDARVEYKEGVFLGYRHYDKTRILARFPFGYGLSYTNFELNDVHINDDVLSLTVKNTGTRAGAEVIQVYAVQEEDHDRPLRSLKAFQKVFLEAGNTVNVEISIPDDFSAYWCEQENIWKLGNAKLEIMVANNSQIYDRLASTH